MRLISLLLIGSLFSHFTYSQNCPPNIDFETGDFSNWQCYIGSTGTSGSQNVITLNPSPPTAGQHEIISTATTDQYGGFPQLCPNGGNYSVKLGNNQTGKGAEGVSYTFQVPLGADTFSITYYYAVVFQNPGHTSIEQPRFFVKAFDVGTGALINCASYDYVASGGIPGFQVSAFNSTVLYKDWTPVSIAFAGLAGHTVELQFKTADCTVGGHFGYAYVDVATGCSGTIATGAYCPGSNSVSLQAPFGYQSYTWWDQTYTNVVGNQRTVTLTPAPPVNTLFHVDMVPFPGYGCRDTAEAKVTLLAIPDTPVAQNYFYCENTIAPPLTATATSGNSLIWYATATGGTGSSIAPVPATGAAGTYYYYVTQKALFGCEGPRKEIVVTVAPMPVTSFSINNPRQCFVNNRFLFTNNSTNLVTGSTYEWDFGDGQTGSLLNGDHAFNSFGNYTVKLKIHNSPACYTEQSQVVTAVPKPVAAFTATDIVCDKQTPVILTDVSTVPSSLSAVTSWYWDAGIFTSTVQNPPSFTAGAGVLKVQLVAGTPEGCLSDTTTHFLDIHYLPLAAFKYSSPLCNNETIHFTDLSSMPAGAPAQESVNKWTWKFDNGVNSADQHPSVNFIQGVFHAKLSVESNFGCKSRETDSVFNIHAKPGIGLTINDSCVYRTIQYTATDLLGTVNEWNWNFGTGFYQNPATVIKNFTSPGSKPVTLIGKTIFGCKDTLIRPFTIYKLQISAGNDTVTAMNEPVQLMAYPSTTVLQYTWSPATGLNNTTIKNPVATYDKDQLYNLSAISDKGCDAYSKVLVRRYKGPEIYIPKAFTPNGDGVNDVLRVFPVGIRSFGSFSVYNRGGQLIFTSTDYSAGWDGTFKSAKADIGNYVVIATAVDYKGNVMFRKENVVLLH